MASVPGAHRGIRHPGPRAGRLRGRRPAGDARRAGAGERHPLRGRHRRPRRAPGGRRPDRGHGHRPRHHGRQGLHPGGGRGPLRHHAGQGTRLHRPQGRHVRQYPRHPRGGREDGGATAAAVRIDRGALRAPRRGHVGEAAGTARRARGDRTTVEAAGDDGARRAGRHRPGGAPGGRPVPHTGGRRRRRLPALRVRQPGAPPAGAGSAGGGRGSGGGRRRCGRGGRRQRPGRRRHSRDRDS